MKTVCQDNKVYFPCFYHSWDTKWTSAAKAAVLVCTRVQQATCQSRVKPSSTKLQCGVKGTSDLSFAVFLWEVSVLHGGSTPFPGALRSLEMLVALSPCHQDPSIRLTFQTPCSLEVSGIQAFGSTWHRPCWKWPIAAHMGGMRAQLAPENSGKERVENIQNFR